MSEGVNEEYYTVAFNIISNAGAAKSLIMEALYEAKEQNYQSAEEKLKESNTFFREAHKAHKALIKKEANGEQLQFSLILVHAEDQLMNVENLSLLVTEIIELYKR